MLPDTVAMNATSDPDTMYFLQAMQETDAKDFLRAAHEEIQNLVERDIIEIIPAYLVPQGMRIFSSV
jgi:flagellar biosynthesis protein FliP